MRISLCTLLKSMYDMLRRYDNIPLRSVDVLINIEWSMICLECWLWVGGNNPSRLEWRLT